MELYIRYHMKENNKTNGMSLQIEKTSEKYPLVWEGSFEMVLGNRLTLYYKVSFGLK